MTPETSFPLALLRLTRRAAHDGPATIVARRDDAGRIAIALAVGLGKRRPAYLDVATFAGDFDALRDFPIVRPCAYALRDRVNEARRGFAR